MSVTPWSYSRMKLFEQCPKKYYHLNIARDYKEPQSDAMRYGNEFHTACEVYIRDGVDLPPAFEFARATLDALAAKDGDKHCEYRMGLTHDLEPCGFSDKNVWYRGIADLIILNGEDAMVVDYKTGKSDKYADPDQLELMALSVFKHFPQIKRVRVGLVFFVPNTLIRNVFLISDADRLWERWFNNVSRMEQAFSNNVWNANPSGLCRRHCVVESCVHNGRNQ